MVVLVVYGAKPLDRALECPFKRYAYKTNLPDIQIGDIVRVPGTWVNDYRPQHATVVEINADHDGPVRSILDKV